MNDETIDPASIDVPVHIIITMLPDNRVQVNGKLSDDPVTTFQMLGAACQVFADFYKKKAAGGIVIAHSFPHKAS